MAECDEGVLDCLRRRSFAADLQDMNRRRWRSNLHLLTSHPGLFVRAYWWALLILIGGAILDAVTTYRNAVWLGVEAEIHPVGRVVMRALGPALGTWVAKLVQTVVVVCVASLWRPWCRWLMVVCGLLYTGAAVSNYFRLL